MKYEFLDDLTSDVLFNAYGADLKHLFENAASAMFEIICEIKNIKKEKKLIIELKAENEKELLYYWLQELIALVDTEEMFFSGFNIIEISNTHLKAEIEGETMTPEKGNTVVKAVTNYKFSLEKIEKGYKASVSLDI